MKKIFNYFGIITLCAVLFSSCEVNEMPKFDDKDAFVAFGSGSVSVSEDCGSVKVPVTLASLSGISSTVTVVANDGTASSGKNYELVTSSLSFTESAPTQYVEVKVVNLAGEFTGDLNFTLTFSNTGNVKAGTENTCTVTIKDNDHPLTPILGNYTAKGNSYWFGSVAWEVTLLKDATDVSKVWFANLAYGIVYYGYGYPSNNTIFYGIVNDDLTEITIPIGQGTPYLYKDSYPIKLYGLTKDLNIVTEGNIVVKISEDHNTLSFNELGLYPYDEASGAWDILLPGIVLTK